MSDYELMVFDEFEYDPETGVLTSDIHELKLYIVNGFYRTKINGNATSIHLLIHDLLGIDRTGMMVVHDDGNKLNNRADNLVLMTRAQGNKHFFDLRQKKRNDKTDN